MIVLDASVAIKWFVDDEPLVSEAREGPPRRIIQPGLVRVLGS